MRYSKSDLLNLPTDKKARTSRRPLESADIEVLINTAVNLHSRAIESRREKRWWINLGISFVGALLGALAAILTT